MTLGEADAFFPGWFLPAAVIAFGLIWGSFLNVVIYRVPREMSVVRPGSHCPGCGAPIAGYDNVPVLSYLILRGRARCCGARMSPRYPLVELIGGVVSLAVFEVAVRSLAPETPIGRAAAIYGADFALAMGLVAAAFIDAEHMILPDSITLGGIVLGIGTASLRGMTFGDAALGAAAGFAGIYVPFTFLYKGLLGRTGMGLGDAKLVGLAGAWFGWQGALFALFAGALQGSVYALVLRVLGVEPKLPEAVQRDIEELEQAAASGDEEAKKLLAEDPLTEDENDAFIVRYVARAWRAFATRVLGREPAPVPAPAPGAAPDEGEGDEGEDDEDAAPRARIPFGPFLILAILELLFAGEWIAERFGLLSL